LGYLVARRNWKACTYMIACVAGTALTVAALGAGPIASFAHMVALRPDSLPLGQPIGLLRHPCNLNVAWFLRFVVEHSIGSRPWVALAGLIVELVIAAISFAATCRLDEDRYFCGFALWIALVTLLSPVAWWQFLACLVPVYLTIAVAAKD